MSGSLINFISQEEFKDFYSRFLAIPMVSIAVDLPGIPSALIDNEKGFRELLAHLIEDHKCRKIAFIKGPVNNADANIRFDIFCDVLKTYNIPIDKELILEGDFRPISGVNAIESLFSKSQLDSSKMYSHEDKISIGTIESLTKRGVSLSENKYSDVQVDAIVCANDNMAIGALQALKVKNISVPEDLIVTGFDNQEESQIVTPLLTTVHQPLYRQGYEGAKMISALLQGEKVSNRILSSELVIRESCGCSPVYNFLFDEKLDIAQEKELPQPFSENKILAELSHFATEFKLENFNSTMGHLIDLYYENIISAESHSFIGFVVHMVQDEFIREDDVLTWYSIFKIIHENIIPFIGLKQRNRARYLIQSALSATEKMLKRQAKLEQIKMESRIYQLRELGQNIFIPGEIDELIHILKEELESFGINNFYLFLYDDTIPIPTHASFFMGFENNKLIEISEKDKRFKLEQLFPRGFLSYSNSISMLVEPLFIGREHFGYAFFEIKDKDYFLYETLRAQISNAIKGNFLLQKRREAESKLKLQLQEKEVLLREVHHRIKNNFNTVKSLLSLQANASDKKDVKQAINTAISSVESIYVIYEKLLVTDDYKELSVKDYFESLISSIKELFSPNKNIIIDRHIAEFKLDSRRLFPLGLIMNELLTNALKYGLKEDKGRIDIHLINSNGKISLTIQDYGDGTPETFDMNRTSGFGIQLVKILAEQLDGFFTMSSDNGAICSVEFRE
ncbi:MAG: substrate-binding domain-containing protein [Spirochaetaceae bacterium]|nr:substrate-binding domain-containing protein [Spirochaetaceae bacterium]